MSKVQLISDSKKRVLKLLLEDNRISGLVLLNGERPQSIKVHDDGSVTFGRTPKKWWNFIFGDEETLNFETVYMRMLKAYREYLPDNSYIAKVFTDKVIDKYLSSGNYDEVVKCFMIYALLGVKEGDYMLDKPSLLDEDPRQQNNASGQQPRRRMSGTIPASINLGGDYFPFDLHIHTE